MSMNGSLGDFEEDPFLGFEVNPSREYVKDISRVWESIYGANDSKRHERIKRLKEQLDEFWQCILEEEETKKNNLVNEIEKKAHEAFNLERALGWPRKVDELGNSPTNSNPLMHHQQQVQQLMEDYYKIKEKRLEEFSNLQAEEKQLCSILNETPMIKTLESGSSEEIPTLDYMRECNDRIDKLRQQKDTLYQDFESYRETLKVLMEDLGIQPSGEFERYACGIGTDYPVNIQNMIKMKICCTEKKRLTEAEIARIIEQCEEGVAKADIAKTFNVSRMTVWRCMKNNSRKTNQPEVSLKSSLEQENILKKDVQEITKSKQQLSLVIEEYEKTISQKEEEKKALEVQKSQLIQERDTATEHLKNREIAFNDIYQKYERGKSTIKDLKTKGRSLMEKSIKNEQLFKECLAERDEAIKLYNAKNEHLEEHAISQLKT